MFRHAGISTGSALFPQRFSLTVGASGAAMGRGASPPDFAPNASAGWFAYTREFIPLASGPGPVVNDPAHPHVSNDEFRATGKQPTTSVADLNNPILQPWAREKVRERNETVLAGKQVFSQHAICWPMGVPAFLLEPMTRPMHFVQGPKEVVMVTTSFNDVRHIYLADKTSRQPQAVLVRRIHRHITKAIHPGG